MKTLAEYKYNNHTNTNTLRYNSDRNCKTIELYCPCKTFNKPKEYFNLLRRDNMRLSYSLSRDKKMQNNNKIIIYHVSHYNFIVIYGIICCGLTLLKYIRNDLHSIVLDNF